MESWYSRRCGNIAMGGSDASSGTQRNAIYHWWLWLWIQRVISVCLGKPSVLTRSLNEESPIIWCCVCRNFAVLYRRGTDCVWLQLGKRAHGLCHEMDLAINRTLIILIDLTMCFLSLKPQSGIGFQEAMFRCTQKQCRCDQEDQRETSRKRVCKTFCVPL